MPPPTQEEAAGYRVQAPDWRLLDGARRAGLSFSEFPRGLAFVERAAALESQVYYPEITFGWGYTTISMNTKKIKGLLENDYIMAAKLDRIAAARPTCQTKTEPLPSNEQRLGCAGAYRRDEKLAKLARGVTQNALDAPANSPGAPSPKEGGAHCPHTSCSLTGRTTAPRK